MRHQLSILLLSIWALFVIAPPASSEDFRVGVLLCLSGGCASYGDQALKALKLSAEDLNSQGGILGRKIVLEVEDTQEAFTGLKALSAYRKLKSRNIQFFIGPGLTPAGLTLGPVVARDKDVVMTSPSLGVSEFSAAGTNIFNSRGPDTQCTKELARLAFSVGLRTAAILSSQQEWEKLQGDLFEEEFKRLGGKVLVKLEPLPSITDLGTEAAKVVAANPDMVFMSNSFQIAIAAKKLMSLGFDKPKFAPYLDANLIEQAGGALEHAVYTELAELTPDFIKKFRERFKMSPEPITGIAYDTLQMYARAIETAETFEPPAVARIIPTLSYGQAAGNFRFNETRNAVRTPLIKSVSCSASQVCRSN